ncbi:trimeric intracellular cation channel family protein [Halomonas garicola]|uniref:trimeric intracellular cation channel family protein n=1 Tax=Halomonas garicola TaxID=1690008 RepID=UPI00289E54B4|nr:trimeric intracellular cation channel family protein [Halomonas garicola]
MSQLVYWLDMAGVIVFALSGVVLACRKRMDPVGMLVLAAVTGIGGGTLRDLVMGVRPVFWVSDPTYLWVIVITVGLALLGFHYIHRLSRGFMPVADAFGLAIFTALGSHKALELGYAGEVATLMGMMTGVAGGMIRDVLAQRMPMVLREEIYATAAFAGGVAYVALYSLGAPTALTIGASVAATLGLRLPAIHWGLALPVFAWVSIPPKPVEDGEAAVQKARKRVRMIRRQRKRR